MANYAMMQRDTILSQALFGEDDNDNPTGLTIKDYEDLLIEVRKLRRENKRLKKELEEWELMSSDITA